MEKRPSVSVIVACKNVAPFVDQCIASALGQAGTDVEVLVIDDGSSDGTRAIVGKWVKEGSCVRLLSGANRGPAAARNIGILNARGDWIAVLDGDDLMHPQRLRRLLDLAAATQADVIGDGLLAFVENGTNRRAWPFFGETFDPDGEVIEVDRLFSRSKAGLESPLGYIKPLVRRSFLTQRGVQYNEELFIGEDFDFLAKLLASGAKMVAISLPLYFYRRHSGSISHRLSVEDARKMLVGAQTFFEDYQTRLSPSARKSVALRLERLRVQKYTQELIYALKAKAYLTSLGIGVTCPMALYRTAYFFIEGILRRVRGLVSENKGVVSLDGVGDIVDDPSAAEDRLALGGATAISKACHVFASSLGAVPDHSSKIEDPYWLGYWHGQPTVTGQVLD